jgi:hypothetical protein
MIIMTMMMITTITITVFLEGLGLGQEFSGLCHVVAVVPCKQWTARAFAGSSGVNRKCNLTNHALSACRSSYICKCPDFCSRQEINIKSC